MKAEEVIKSVNEEASRRERLNERIHWFIATYMPEDKEKAYRFSADLMMLTRDLHTDASYEPRKIMQSMLAIMPNPLHTVKGDL